MTDITELSAILIDLTKSPLTKGTVEHDLLDQTQRHIAAIMLQRVSQFQKDHLEYAIGIKSGQPD
jgi:hypothetical protein